MKIGQCKLCGTFKKLLSKSHILPRWMYEGVKDEQNRLWKLNPQKMESLNGGFEQNNGYYDKDILCENCDNVITNKYENYLSHIVLGKPSRTPATFYQPMKDNVLEVTDFDYKSIKLGLLSILWKCHISANPFFEYLKLPFIAEVQIRKMLITGNIDDDKKFKLAIMGLKRTDGQMVRMVLKPGLLPLINGKRIAFYIANGFLFFIEVEPFSEFKLFEAYPLSDSKLPVPILNADESFTILTVFNLPHTFIRFILDVDTRGKVRREIYELGLQFCHAVSPVIMEELVKKILTRLSNLPYSETGKKVSFKLQTREAIILHRYIEAVKLGEIKLKDSQKRNTSLKNLINSVNLSELFEE